MKILVVNCGSSSIKFHVYDGAAKALAKGIISRIGQKSSYTEFEAKGNRSKKETEAVDHRTGFDLMVETLLQPQHGVMQDIHEVSAVGHRAVHGGERFTGSVLVTDDVVHEMEKLVPLAPLHNPANLIGIREARRVLPDVPHVAVFDTAFHQTLPPRAYVYGLPYSYYQKHRIRKYGFHGTSCLYVSRRAAEITGKPIEQMKMIVCHLGNGVTVAAVDGGKSIDTSMGLTPLEGLLMGTRCGDIDAGVIFFMHRQLGLSIDRIDSLLNKESGLLGVAGVSNDMQEIEEKASRGDERCKLAIEMFTYRVKKYIGAYAAALGGVDTLVFTGGIGENSHAVRKMICEGLSFLGVDIDAKANGEAKGIERLISKPRSKASVVVVPTNEEKIIALDTMRIGGLLETG